MPRSHQLRAAFIGVTLVCLAACAPRGSSFETLGVPTPQVFEDEGAVIIGWAREDRESWSIHQVRIDFRRRSEWNRETQAPTTIHLEKGEHVLRLYAARSTPSSHRRGRRVKLRPIRITLATGQVQLCVLDITKRERRRLVANCVHYLGESPATPSKLETTGEAARSNRDSAGEDAECSPSTDGADHLEGVLARLARIEQQLQQLSSSQGDPRPGAKSPSSNAKRGGDAKLAIDTVFPIYSGKQPRRRNPYERFEHRGKLIESYEDNAAGD